MFWPWFQSWLLIVLPKAMPPVTLQLYRCFVSPDHVIKIFIFFHPSACCQRFTIARLILNPLCHNRSSNCMAVVSSSTCIFASIICITSRVILMLGLPDPIFLVKAVQFGDSHQGSQLVLRYCDTFEQV